MSGAKTHFFSHDFNARNNYKMLELREAFGYEGYGIFWAICETISENDKPIQLNKLGIIAMSLGIDKILLVKIIDLCLEVNLFQDVDGLLTSEALESRLDMKRKATERAKKGAEARWNKTKEANAKDKQSTSNAQAMLKQSTSNAHNTTQHDTTQHNTKRNNNIEGKPSNSIKKREEEFASELASYVDEYGKEFIRGFFDYWTEANKSKTKMRFESEKTWDTSRRLKRWRATSQSKGLSAQVQKPQPKTFAQIEIEQAKENMRQAQETLENW